MSRRPSVLAVAALAALLLLPLSLPLVAADHAYSHRYVIFGRVVDADGNPVANVEADMATLTPQFFSPENLCQQDPGTDLSTDAFGRTVHRPLTDSRGDFIFCFHVHALNRVEPGRGVVTVKGVPEFQPLEIEMDPYHRTTHLLLQLPVQHANANPEALLSSHTIVGRLWSETGETRVEAQRVYGVTVDQHPINISLLDADGTLVGAVDTLTNDYGDVAVRLDTSSHVANGTIVVRTSAKEERYPAGEFGITSFKLDMPPPESTLLSTVLWAGLGLIVAGAVIGGGYWGINKLTEQREMNAVRQTSTRKRAKK